MVQVESARSEKEGRGNMVRTLEKTHAGADASRGSPCASVGNGTYSCVMCVDSLVRSLGH